MDNELATAYKNVLLVGDERSGKIGLIFSYFIGELPPNERQIYKEYRTEVDLDGEKVPLEIWIAPCQEHYDGIRTLSYKNVEAVLLCFSIDDPASLTHAAEKWFQEIKQYAPNAAIILVGNKIDLRNDPDVINRLADQSLSPVTYEQGKEIADKLKCYQYVENSAKNVENVKDVFKAAAAAILSK